MADEVEKIRLDFDTTDAEKAKDKFNAGLDVTEKKATEAVESIGNLTKEVGTSISTLSARSVTVIQGSAESARRAIQSLQKTVAAAEGQTPIQRIQQNRQRDLDRFSGNTKAVSDLTGLYDRLTAAQQRADGSALFDKQRVSFQRYADAVKKAGLEDLAQARAEEQLVKQQAATRSSIVDRVTRQAATPAQRVQLDRSAALKQFSQSGGNVFGSSSELNQLEQGFKTLESQAAKSAGSIGSSIAQFITSPTYAGRKALGNLIDDFGKAGLIIGGTFVAIGVAAKAAFSVVSEQASQATATLNLSTRIGSSAQQADQLTSALKAQGVEVEAVTGFTRKLSQAIADGGGEGKKGQAALRELGLSAFNYGGALKEPYQLTLEIADALKNLPTAKFNQVLGDLGGRGALELGPAFRNLSGELVKVGPGLQNNVINRLHEADEAIKILGNRFRIFEGQASASLLGAGDGLIRFKQKVNDLEVVLLSFIAVSSKARIIATAFENGNLGADQVKPNAARLRPAGPDLGISTDQAAGNKAAESFRSRITNSLDLAARVTEAQGKLAELESAATSTGQGTKATAAAQSAYQAAQNNLAGLKAQQKAYEEFETAVKGAQDAALSAQEHQYTGTTGVIEKYAILTQHLKDLYAAAAGVASKGDLQKALGGLDQARIADLAKAAAAEVTEIGKKAADTTILVAKLNEELAKTRAADTRTTADLVSKDQLAQLKQYYELADQQAGLQRDRDLHNVEFLNAKTLDEKVALEQKKADIETTYLQKIQAIRLAGIQADSNVELKKIQDDADAELEIRRTAAQQKFTESLKNFAGTPEQFKALNDDYAKSLAETQISSARDTTEKIDALNKSAEGQRLQLSLSTTDQIYKAQADAALRSAELIRDANTKVFDSVKEAAGEVFDDTFKKGSNFAKALGDQFKKIFTNTAKELFSNALAVPLTSALTGQNVGLESNAVGTGPLASIQRGLGIGARPTFKSAQLDKLDQAGHLGDIVAVSTNSGPAVPVFIANPGDISVQDIRVTNATLSKTNTISQSITAPGGSGASAGSAGGRATLGLASLLAGLAAAAPVLSQSSGPGKQGSAVSTIDYGDGNGPQLVDFGNSSGSGSVAPDLAQFAGIAPPGGGGNSDLAQGSINQLVKLGQGGLPGGISIPGLNTSGGGFEEGGAASGVGGFSGPGSSAGGGILGQLLGGLTGGGKGGSGQGLLGAIFNKNAGKIGTAGVDGQPGVDLGTGFGSSAAGGIANGVVGSPLAGALGLSLLLGSFKNSKSAQSAVLAPAGGALFGANLALTNPVVSNFVGGPIGGAAVGAGVGLFANGIARGGGLGVAEDIGGGALAGGAIGLQYGGPAGALIGAGIGAAVGAVAGIVRLFVKTKAEKAQALIKSTYGVDIKDQGILAQIMQIINQNYGGDIHAGILALPVRQLIELYAESTGQNAKGIVNTPVAAQFSNSGNKLTQVAQTFDGQSVLPGDLSSTAGLPTLNPNGGYTVTPSYSNQGANTVGGPTSLTLDASATQALLTGQAASVIQNNPRMVADSANSGVDQSASRRSLGASLLNPNFVSS